MGYSNTKYSHGGVVVSINLKPHPNADTLSIVDVGEYNVVVKTADWSTVKLGVFIPPQTIVDTDRQEFLFLKKGNKRYVIVKPCKLRGVTSSGILIPAPSDVAEGDVIADRYGLEHYEPEETKMGDEDGEYHTFFNLSKYDIDSYLKFKDDFLHNEQVFVTEKLHGSNLRCYYDGDKIRVGSRSTWKKESNSCIFWRAFRSHPSFEKFCLANPNTILYGEAYNNGQKAGGVQFIYDGKVSHNVKLRLFDIKTKDGFLNCLDFFDICRENDLPTVPLLGIVPFNLDLLLMLSRGKSYLGDHIKEGIVIKPAVERLNRRYDRIVCKIINDEYNQL